jgi:two-component system phosphate regulon response regulator PhoB
MHARVNERILIADDEPDLLTLLSTNLKAAGFHTVTAADGSTALAIARRDPPALVVLDVMMPDMNGFEVCRELKRNPDTADIAILLLTARKDEIDRILGFELGVDDYMVKPFSPRELVLRIQAILRRRQTPMQTATHLSCGRLALDREKHLVTIDGAPVQCTAIEYRLLCTFLERPGIVLSREQVFAKVWPAESEIELRTIDTHLRRLREKLGPAGEQIETVRGFGYRLAE